MILGMLTFSTLPFLVFLTKLLFASIFYFLNPLISTINSRNLTLRCVKTVYVAWLISFKYEKHWHWGICSNTSLFYAASDLLVTSLMMTERFDFLLGKYPSI
jgi:hypothetical protein